tara:strand:- start:578 stop:1246 length:669 start_codon:yes stop_codon:yes gene_type:complete
MKKNFLIITNQKSFIVRTFKEYKRYCNYQIYDLKKENEKKLFLKSKRKFDFLISFANGYIFRKSFLNKFSTFRRINFHPATPNYPGRDVQHFACYNKEKYFGGTMHIMTEKLDRGPILDVKKFKLKSKNNTHEYFQKVGIRAIQNLFKKNLKKIINGNLKIRKSIKWGKKIYTRKKFLSKLGINADMKKDSLQHLVNSFYTKNHKSLYIRLFEKKFYLKLYE